jgi:hypothetical protein
MVPHGGDLVSGKLGAKVGGGLVQGGPASIVGLSALHRV